MSQINFTSPDLVYANNFMNFHEIAKYFNKNAIVVQMSCLIADRGNVTKKKKRLSWNI